MARSSLDKVGRGSEELLESTTEFEAAYETHAQSIQRFLFWRTQDAQTADDLTSSVFEKAWRSRRSFRGGSVSAWLYRIAHNVLIDHWRKKPDLPVEDIDRLAHPTNAPSAGEVLDQERQAERLQVAIGTLPPQMQSVIRLRFIEGLPSGQVARKLHLSESNVRVIQYRALKKLRDYLT